MNEENITTTFKYTPADFKGAGEVRWCPGCGDHAILATVQKTMPEIASEMKVPLENFVFISGIGCSSRFPYYMNAYGMHTIHGRAPIIATGVKLSNPYLLVFQITGDGDALAIGGNHFIHAIRRNIDINILLFNNKIYGLTKGQFSPTSNQGIKTKTSPNGSIDREFKAGSLVIGASGTYFARTVDVDMPLTALCLKRSVKHKGTSVTEILQNCVIFNDKVHDSYIGKENRANHSIVLEDGKPMLFGKDKEFGIALDGLKLVVVDAKGNINKILIHNSREQDSTLHSLLINMDGDILPIALGIIRDVECESYNDKLETQLKEIGSSSKYKTLKDVMINSDTWSVE